LIDRASPALPVGNEPWWTVGALGFANRDPDVVTAVMLEDAVLRNKWIGEFALGDNCRIAQSWTDICKPFAYNHVLLIHCSLPIMEYLSVINEPMLRADYYRALAVC